MEDVVKIDFAKCLGYGPHPFSLPQHIADFYDRFAKASKQILSSPRPDRIRDHVVIAVLADIYKDFNDRLVALEASRKPIETPAANGSVAAEIPYEIGVHDPEISKRKVVDGRTREGRMLREQAVGA